MVVIMWLIDTLFNFGMTKPKAKQKVKTEIFLENQKRN